MIQRALMTFAFLPTSRQDCQTARPCVAFVNAAIVQIVRYETAVGYRRNVFDPPGTINCASAHANP